MSGGARGSSHDRHDHCDLFPEGWRAGLRDISGSLAEHGHASVAAAGEADHMGSSQVSTEEMMRAKHVLTDRRRYIKMRPIDGGPWAVIEAGDLDSMLDGEELETFETTDVWMTKAEYEALGEFNGW